jgi:hypothetical protein
MKYKKHPPTPNKKCKKKKKTDTKTKEKKKILVMAEEEWSSHLFKGERGSSHLGLSNLSLSNK